MKEFSTLKKILFEEQDNVQQEKELLQYWLGQMPQYFILLKGMEI